MRVFNLVQLLRSKQKLLITNVNLFERWSGCVKDIPPNISKRYIKEIKTLKNDVLGIELEDK